MAGKLKGEKAPHRHKRISFKDSIISYKPDFLKKSGLFIRKESLSPNNSFFEVEIIDAGILGRIGIGVSHYFYSFEKILGQDFDSVAYYSDTGRLFKSNPRSQVFGAKYGTGDIIGCGVKFEQISYDERQKSLFPVYFTKNGKEIGVELVHMNSKDICPAISISCENGKVRIIPDARFGNDIDTNNKNREIILMSVDNCEEDWCRLHNVRLSGNCLEYMGKGKSINDVGLAQAKLALDTTIHYYEIEIVDPGESCYIAIGLARRDYPKHRHPGWNKGSIAYHADDGKIFVGSGVGEAFGPKCKKGDIMGCGILFPKDYNCDRDQNIFIEDEIDNYSDCDEYLENECLSSDSEDEEWWEKPCAENGTKVQVFFTHNGKLVGKREVRIPRGGFYPTIGMLSTDEKVRVDLRPLTG